MRNVRSPAVRAVGTPPHLEGELRGHSRFGRAQVVGGVVAELAPGDEVFARP